MVVVDRAERLVGRVGGLISAGWVDRAGLRLPDRPWDIADRRWLAHGVVADEPAAAAAVLAAVRGAAVAVGCADADLRDLLVDDLGRIGAVELEELGPDPLEALDAEQRALLEALAAGRSIVDAAAALFLSPRTAERRVAGLRHALGVRTTAEAISLAATGRAG
jgi:DNA-binding NarL/FixJ family response regulator